MFSRLTALRPARQAVRFAATMKEAAPPREKREFRGPRNAKLRDIAHQVKIALEGSDRSEAIDILEEGVSYLREIQATERIDERLLYNVFQKNTAVILREKFPKPLAEIVALLEEHRIVHQAHLLPLAVEEAQKKNYSGVMQIWLRHLGHQRQISGYTLWQDAYAGFRPYHLLNLVYFAYLVQCLESGVEYSVKDATRLLQTEVSKLPPLGVLAATLKELKIANEDVENLMKNGRALLTKLMDPNGAEVARMVRIHTQNRSVAGLDTLYGQVRESSASNDIAVLEDTVVRFMRAYIELGLFGSVLPLFQLLVAAKISPSASLWECLLLGTAHPQKVAQMDAAERAKAVQLVEGIYATVAGTALAKTVAVVVGCFATLDQMERAETVMGSHPVHPSAKNNVLLGLIGNGHVEQAEQRLKEYTAQSFFKASTHVMNAFLAHYTRRGQYETVEQLFKYMRAHEIPEDVGTLTTMINYYFAMYKEKGLVPDVESLLQQVSRGSVALNEQSITALVLGLAGDGTLPAARAVFEHFLRAQPRLRRSAGVQTAMLNAELNHGSLDAAQTLFQHYIAEVRNDTRMWNMMIKGLAAQRHDDAVLETYARLVAQRALGVVPNHFTFYFLLDHFGKRNSPVVQRLLDDLAALDLKTYGTALPGMVQRLAAKHNVDPALLERMRCT